MGEQISIKQSREAIRVTQGLIPVLTQDELVEVMRVFQNVVDRLLDEINEEVAE